MTGISRMAPIMTLKLNVNPNAELQEAREQTQRAVGEAHVPVGLGARGHRRRVIGAVRQIGLIVTRADIRATTPKTMKKNTPAFAAYTGMTG